MIGALAIIAGIHVLVTLLQLVGLHRIKPYAAAPSDDDIPKLSLIIAAKNEAANLKSNLETFLAQDYPNYEVIVVDDHSSDDTLTILEAMSKSYAQLRVGSNNQGSGKKTALTQGIDMAKSNYLVFTDADCRALDAKFLHRYAGAFMEGNELVLGVGLTTGDANIWQRLHRLETARIAIRYLCASVFNLTYMGVGRSMGYTKALFDQVEGYRAHEHIKSGDDDLFIQSVPPKVKIAQLTAAVTISEAPVSLASWFSQKQRHLSTGNRYPGSVLLGLGLIEFTEWLFGFGLLVLIFVQTYAELFMLAFYGLALILRWVLLHRFELKTKRIARLAILFFLEPILYLMNPLFSVASQIFGEPTEWKKRT